MTRKTKEEKKIAAYRKKLQFLQAMTKSKIVEEPKKVDQPLNVKAIEAIESQSKPAHFLKDLKKSFVLIFFIITLEIIIYFVSINR